MFASDFGWSRSYGLKSKGDAHLALSLLFQREGVPDKLISDNAKEQSLGIFRKKCQEAGCATRTTEPYSPWQNTCEREIRELKKGVARHMTRMEVPIRLWDYALELTSYSY